MNPKVSLMMITSRECGTFVHNSCAGPIDV